MHNVIFSPLSVGILGSGGRGGLEQQTFAGLRKILLLYYSVQMETL